MCIRDRYYTSDICPPNEIAGYRDPRGMRPILSAEEELYSLSQYISDHTSSTAIKYALIIERIQKADYLDIDAFSVDLTAFLDDVRIQNREANNIASNITIWSEAASLLSEQHWSKYYFDAEETLSNIPKL